MIDRALFVPDGSNPPFPAPVNEHCTVPTEGMAYLLADLLQTTGDVLELGTGSGYQTAVLAERCRFVVSVEARPCIEVGNKLPENVAIFPGDAFTFHTGEEFDGVLVTFGTRYISKHWIEQLKQGARLVVPIQLGDASCRLSVYERRGDSIVLVDAVGYAPFTEACQA